MQNLKWVQYAGTWVDTGPSDSVHINALKKASHLSTWMKTEWFDWLYPGISPPACCRPLNPEHVVCEGLAEGQLVHWWLWFQLAGAADIDLQLRTVKKTLWRAVDDQMEYELKYT